MHKLSAQSGQLALWDTIPNAILQEIPGKVNMQEVKIIRPKGTGFDRGCKAVLGLPEISRFFPEAADTGAGFLPLFW